MFTQSAPFGMYGFGQMGGWPQYPVPPQLLWQNPWQSAQVANPWLIQALIAELVGNIARQQHFAPTHPGIGYAGLGQGVANPWATQGSYGNGIGALGLNTMGAGLPFPTPVANWSMPVPAMV